MVILLKKQNSAKKKILNTKFLSAFLLKILQHVPQRNCAKYAIFLSALTLQADGKARPASPQAPGIDVVTRWMGTHGLETIGQRGEVILGRGAYEVSADGRTLTAKVLGTDAQGAAFEQEIVFDRE